MAQARSHPDAKRQPPNKGPPQQTIIPRMFPEPEEPIAASAEGGQWRLRGRAELRPSGGSTPHVQRTGVWNWGSPRAVAEQRSGCECSGHSRRKGLGRHRGSLRPDERDALQDPVILCKGSRRIYQRQERCVGVGSWQLRLLQDQWNRTHCQNQLPRRDHSRIPESGWLPGRSQVRVQAGAPQQLSGPLRPAVTRDGPCATPWITELRDWACHVAPLPSSPGLPCNAPPSCPGCSATSLHALRSVPQAYSGACSGL